jgi:hypothetical protein
MITCYNRIAGQSVEPRRSERRHFRRGHDSSRHRPARSRARIDAPRARPPPSSLRRLAGSPRLPAEFSCFGNFLGQQSQLNHLRRSDIRLTWIHLAFLFAVTLMPFSTKLLGTRHAYRTAYSNTGATSSSLAPCFTPAGVTPPAPASSRTTSLPKCPLLSVAALSSISLGMPSGAVLCVFSTYLSVRIIIFVQWFYILSPWLRLPPTENPSTPPANP